MKVRVRLLLFGVMAPAAGLTLALLIAGFTFREEQLASVDRELRARAAVESVGVSEGEGLHLHLGRAPFASGFSDFDPRGALYDEQRLVTHDPSGSAAPGRGPFAYEQLNEPRLWTAGGRRELAVAVPGADAGRYVLRMSCSLKPVRETLNAYLRTTTALIALVVLLLVALWTWLARSLSDRLEHITQRLPAGDELPSWQVEPGAPADEITALDSALQAAFGRLRKAKEAQDEFLGRAAHELKTPLGVMGAEIDLALRRERSVDELRQALVGSRREVQRLAQLSERLLDLTAVSGLQLEHADVDLVRVLYEAVDSAEAAFDNAGVKVLVHAPGQALCRGDSQLLRQALDNLLANAIRYAPKGSTIRCEVSVQRDKVSVEIADEGPGIPENEHDRIFQPFVRGKSAQGQGTGLGLAIVQAITTRLHGDVQVVPAPNGACFRLRFPVPNRASQ